MSVPGIPVLSRWCDGPMGTFGTLRLDDWECFTCELPWLDNARGKSCIPTGIYPFKKSYYYGGGYDCWEICDVPGRDEIKLHIGNTIIDVEGCVVVGTALGFIKRKWAVTSSGIAFRAFMELMEGIPETSIVIESQTMRA